VAFAVAAMYVTGVAIMTVTETASSLVMRLIRRPPSATPWANSYWRRVAAHYVGSGLSPDAASFSSSEDLDRLSKYIVGLAGEEDKQLGIAQMRESNLALQKSLESFTETITAATAHPQKSEVVALLDDARKKTAELTSKWQAHTEAIENTERQLRSMGIGFEWISLYHALQFMRFPDVTHPYGGFSMLMTSLQAAGVAALWLLVQFRMWNLPGLIFAAALVLATSYSIWQEARLGTWFMDLDSAQLAGMIQEIRQHESSTSE
jgi:hypothetical protein